VLCADRYAVGMASITIASLQRAQLGVWSRTSCRRTAAAVVFERYLKVPRAFRRSVGKKVRCASCSIMHVVKYVQKNAALYNRFRPR